MDTKVKSQSVGVALAQLVCGLVVGCAVIGIIFGIISSLNQISLTAIGHKGPLILLNLMTLLAWSIIYRLFDFNKMILAVDVNTSLNRVLLRTLSIFLWGSVLSWSIYQTYFIINPV